MADVSLSFPYTWEEKTILWHNAQGYRIASGNAEHNYLTLWTDDNQCVGSLNSSVIKKRHPGSGENENRAKINSVTINPKHRGVRLGEQLFRVLLEWLPVYVNGVYSYLPDRSNRKQIPKIYQRLGGYILDGDHAFIDRT